MVLQRNKVRNKYYSIVKSLVDYMGKRMPPKPYRQAAIHSLILQHWDKITKDIGKRHRRGGQKPVSVPPGNGSQQLPRAVYKPRPAPVEMHPSPCLSSPTAPEAAAASPADWSETVKGSTEGLHLQSTSADRTPQLQCSADPEQAGSLPQQRPAPILTTHSYIGLLTDDVVEPQTPAETPPQLSRAFTAEGPQSQHASPQKTGIDASSLPVSREPNTGSLAFMSEGPQSQHASPQQPGINTSGQAVSIRQLTVHHGAQRPGEGQLGGEYLQDRSRPQSAKKHSLSSGRKAPKLALRVTPKDPETAEAVERQGMHAYFELSCRGHKTMADLAVALEVQWGEAHKRIGRRRLLLWGTLNSMPVLCWGPVSHPGITVGDVHRTLGQPTPFDLTYTLQQESSSPAEETHSDGIPVGAEATAVAAAPSQGAASQDQQPRPDADDWKHACADMPATKQGSAQARQPNADSSEQQQRKRKVQSPLQSEGAEQKDAAMQQQTLNGQKQRRLHAQRIDTVPAAVAQGPSAACQMHTKPSQAQPMRLAEEASGASPGLFGNRSPQRETCHLTWREQDPFRSRHPGSRFGTEDSKGRSLHAAGDSHGFRSLFSGGATCDGFASLQDAPAMPALGHSMQYAELPSHSSMQLPAPAGQPDSNTELPKKPANHNGPLDASGRGRSVHAAGDSHGFSGLYQNMPRCDDFVSLQDAPSMPASRESPQHSDEPGHFAVQRASLADPPASKAEAPKEAVNDQPAPGAQVSYRQLLEAEFSEVSSCEDAAHGERSKDETAGPQTGSIDTQGEQVAEVAVASSEASQRGASLARSLGLGRPGTTCSGFESRLGLLQQGRGNLAHDECCADEAAQPQAGVTVTDMQGERVAAAAAASAGASHLEASVLSLNIFTGATCSGFGTSLGLFKQGATCTGFETSFSGLFGRKEAPGQHQADDTATDSAAKSQPESATGGSKAETTFSGLFGRKQASEQCKPGESLPDNTAKSQPECTAAQGKAGQDGGETFQIEDSIDRAHTRVGDSAGERSHSRGSKPGTETENQEEALSFAGVFGEIGKRKQPSRLAKKSTGTGIAQDQDDSMQQEKHKEGSKQQGKRASKRKLQDATLRKPSQAGATRKRQAKLPGRIFSEQTLDGLAYGTASQLSAIAACDLPDDLPAEPVVFWPSRAQDTLSDHGLSGQASAAQVPMEDFQPSQLGSLLGNGNSWDAPSGTASAAAGTTFCSERPFAELFAQQMI